MKMLATHHRNRVAAVAASATGLLFLGCPSGRKIQTQDDADLVARSLWKQIRMTVPYGTPATYTNRMIAGSVSGSLVANGAVEHSSYYDGMFDWDVYTYDNLVLGCNDFCASNDFTDVHFTGSATLGGSMQCRWSDYWYEYLYLGQWTFLGSGQLSGTYSGDVTLDLPFTYRCGDEFSGHLAAGGKEWDVTFNLQ
jgi:hypothetical protein